MSSHRLLVFHPPMSWLKALASSNIPDHGLSPITCIPSSDVLVKSLNALLNIKVMLVTERVFHPLMSWLKSYAPFKHRVHVSDRRGVPSADVSVKFTGISKHIYRMWSNLIHSNLPMSCLKTEAFLNILFMSVTLLVSHPPMS